MNKKDELFNNYENEVEKIHNEMNALPDHHRLSNFAMCFSAITCSFVCLALVSIITHSPIVFSSIWAGCGLVSAVGSGVLGLKSHKTRKKLELLEKQEKDMFATLCKEVDKIDMAKISTTNNQQEKSFSKEKVEVTCWETDKEVAESIAKVKNHTPNKNISFKAKDNDLER